MAYTELSICNLALSKLGADVITDLDATDKVSALCKQMYSPARDFVCVLIDGIVLLERLI